MNNNAEISGLNGIQHKSDQSRGTRSITFRLDSAILDELQHEANQREISLNVLINQTLKRYCQWDRYENRIGMMPVPKIMLSSLIDKAISIAKNNGIEDIEPYRDDIIKKRWVQLANCAHDISFCNYSYRSLILVA